MVAVGVDVGATLAKLALWEAAGPTFRLLPAHDLAEVARVVRSMAPSSVGLTGGGARSLEELLELPAQHVNEFAAWGSGASSLLGSGGSTVRERYLLVSVGTGTSAMLVDGMAVSRTGGTALGGGAVLGLGTALLGVNDFSELVALASRGSRRHVDLLVSDIYGAGEIALAGELTAASFGKLARGGAQPSPEDLAAAVMGLVGENIALICAGLAGAAQVQKVVYGGSTLRDNAALAAVLRQVTGLLGREATILEDGEFAGALGALEFARRV